MFGFFFFPIGIVGEDVIDASSGFFKRFFEGIGAFFRNEPALTFQNCNVQFLFACVLQNVICLKASGHFFFRSDIDVLICF